MRRAVATAAPLNVASPVAGRRPPRAPARAGKRLHERHRPAAAAAPRSEARHRPRPAAPRPEPVGDGAGAAGGAARARRQRRRAAPARRRRQRPARRVRAACARAPAAGPTAARSEPHRPAPRRPARVGALVPVHGSDSADQGAAPAGPRSRAGPTGRPRPESTRPMIWGTVAPSKTRVPPSISARVQPIAHTSQDSSHSSPRICSGAM